MTDVLIDLQELVELYTAAFYDGEANEHVMQHINEMRKLSSGTIIQMQY